VNQPVLGIIAPHPPIMVPEVGRDEAAVTIESAEAMHAAARLLAEFDPDTVVVMSPHSSAVRDAFAIDAGDRLDGDLAQFGAPEVALHVKGDPQLARAVMAEAEARDLPTIDRRRIPNGTEADHGILVPMSFLDPQGHWPVLGLSLSMLPLPHHREFGRAVAAAANKLGRRIAFVASGDCSHRLKPGAPAGYSRSAPKFDQELARLIATGDFEGLMEIDPRLVEEAGECGLRSFVTLGGVLENSDAAARLLAYEGPWGVGYLTAVAGPPQLIASLAEDTPVAGHKGGSPGDDESAPVRLARAAIGTYVQYGDVLDDYPHDDPLFEDRAGCFVSLHEEEQLRGCIGTIVPTQDTLGQEIVRNAIEAATDDPRFPPLSPDELDRLEISVDVLHAPEGVAGLEQLDPKKYGVIVSCGYRRGLLLPDLEGVDTCEHQVSIAMRKGGIGQGEKVCIERFKVDRYH